MRNTIRFERGRLGISQEELAEKVGVSRQTIYAIEVGKFVPSCVLALKLATILNQKIDQIFILEDGDW
ncbi:MAG: helix-turn-helix transcriptional regulator [Cytophagales bacterium]